MNSADKCTAIFGGAFDPFHNGHVAAIKLLLSVPTIERILVVPSGDRPDKSGASPARDRFEQVQRGIKAVFRDNPRIIVSDVQSVGAIGFATIDLVLYAQKEFGGEVAVVIGHDLLKDLPNWHRSQELKEIAHFLVFERPGVAAQKALKGWRVTFLPPFGELAVDLSSTELRARLALGDKCEGLMPDTSESSRLPSKPSRN
jgi:nicotinate-nucleotide adenylyltransferase